MAVRTSPAGGRALPGWVRAREGGEPTTIHLTVVEPGAVTVEAARRCRAQLGAAGYRRAVTNAMAPDDAGALLAAGFAVREHLDLLSRGLDDLPDPTGRTRRTRRLDAVAALDQMAFGPRAFDRAALRDALDATPRARLRVSGAPRSPRGYAVTGVAGWRGYVQRLGVRPDARRQGIGLVLVLDGLRWARRRGARTAFVNTHAGNAAARSLYESIGFTSWPSGLLVLECTL